MRKIFQAHLWLIPVAIAAAALAVSRAGSAQPGTETDPVVSLSYLEAAMAVAPVAIEGGEDIQIAGGRGITLLEGSCRLLGPDAGRYWIVDTTSGEVLSGGTEMVAGHWYVPVGGGGDGGDGEESAVFTVQAWQASVLAIPGGVGR